MKSTLLKSCHLSPGNIPGAGFVVLLGLVLLLGYLSLSSINLMQHDVKVLIHSNSEKIRLVYDMRIYTRERSLILYKILQQKDIFERDNLLTQYYQYGSSFALARKQFESIMDTTEKKFFLSVVYNVRKIIPHQLEVLNLALQKKDKQANKILNEHVQRPQQRVSQSLDALYDYQNSNSKYLYKDILAQQKHSQITTIILTHVILITGFYIAFTTVTKNKEFISKLKQSTSTTKKNTKPALIHDATKLFIDKTNRKLQPASVKMQHTNKIKPRKL